MTLYDFDRDGHRINYEHFGENPDDYYAWWDRLDNVRPGDEDEFELYDEIDDPDDDDPGWDPTLPL